MRHFLLEFSVWIKMCGKYKRHIGFERLNRKMNVKYLIDVKFSTD